MSHHGLNPFEGLEHLCTPGSFRAGRFARLLGDLPPLYVDPGILQELGKPGGVMEDKGDPNLTQDVPAGLIFFGQFVDHDITLDISSSLSANNDPQGTENIRTPTLDLDCVYGRGPEADPFLYDGAGKLLTGAQYASDPAGLENHDLPRTALPQLPNRQVAIIGDPRNDENRVISQMQLGFLRFHNRIVDELAAQPEPPTGAELFEEARRIATWHYQWIVIHDYLRTLCGNWIIDDIFANGRRIYRPEKLGTGDPFIPIEFAAAAYRFGHTMIPQRFRVQPGGPQHDVFGTSLGLGFSPVTSLDQVVQWEALLDDGSGNFERAAQLEIKLAPSLLDLPFLGHLPAPRRSLAVRNLLRGQSFLLPSGERIARAMIAAGADEITEEMIDRVRERGDKIGLPKATPFWLYVLAEGAVIGRMDETGPDQKVFDKAEGLGPVGARFVAEVLIGLLELDPRSYLGANRNWSPLDEDRLGTDGVTNLFQLLTF